MEPRRLVGLKGIFKLYPIDKWDKIFHIPTIFTWGIFFVASILNVDFYDFLVALCDKTIDVIPNLLGFLLGGYTMFVAFGNEKLMIRLTKTDISNPNSRTPFQVFSVIFAFSLICQSILLLIGILIHYTTDIISSLRFPLVLANTTNITLGYLILLLLIIAILSITHSIINIFNLSQIYNSSLIREQENVDKTVTTSYTEPKKNKKEEKAKKKFWQECRNSCYIILTIWLITSTLPFVFYNYSEVNTSINYNTYLVNVITTTLLIILIYIKYLKRRNKHR